MKTCQNCLGTGEEPRLYSCCGDDITDNDIDLCPTCGEHCGDEHETCDECDGRGEIEEDEPMCSACNGTGEGQYDGSRCNVCKGKG